jgi:acetyltransferase-like isoleucine patch superfamily enzyme
MIHPLSEVKTKFIGKNTTIWQFSVILDNAIIGNNCNINCHVFIENNVIIGNSVTVKSGVCLWDGIKIEDNVFIGPNATFTNDPTPRSKKYPQDFQNTILKRNCSIGAAAIVLGGISIGEFAMVGAGSLVTKNVPARALVIGSPAKIVAWLNEDCTKMTPNGKDFIDNNGNKWIQQGEELIKSSKQSNKHNRI